MESLKAGLSKATNVVSNAAEEAQEKARAISVDAKEKVADVKEKVADVKEKVKDAKDAAVEKLKDASLGLAKRVATAAPQLLVLHTKALKRTCSPTCWQ